MGHMDAFWRPRLARGPTSCCSFTHAMWHNWAALISEETKSSGSRAEYYNWSRSTKGEILTLLAQPYGAVASGNRTGVGFDCWGASGQGARTAGERDCWERLWRLKPGLAAQ